MNRPRYYLSIGLAVTALIVAATYAVADMPNLVEYSLHAATFGLAGIALFAGFMLVEPFARERLSRDTLVPSVGSTSHPADLYRARSFLGRLLSPMSGGHRISGFGRAGFGRVGFGRI